MKKSLSPGLKAPGPLRSRRGAALIIVLALLVLISALIVAFLGRTSVERTASASYDASSRARILSDTAVNLVQAAINEASSTDGRSVWASQPGAIRVFDDQGDLQKIYRLYSASQLSENTASGNVLANDLPPDGWSANTAEWVDLNAPVTVNNGGTPYKVFPILDPRDPKVSSGDVLTDLEGFEITNDAPVETPDQAAPMPVRWLYVLDDGQIVPATDGADGVALVAGATRNNPIVGRIAYWTDDDTSKVNINTAAGSHRLVGDKVLPSPWETPRLKIPEDKLLFSHGQPVKLEYQRYPGHPATTSLYSIFTALGASFNMFPYSGTPSPGTSSEYFTVFPRYNDDNGSYGGLVRTSAKGANLTAITKGTDRLYASIGEVLFQPDRTSLSAFDRQRIETGKFFLTAQSRAPEVTLFGTPRISMWPVDVAYSANPGTNLVTPFDRLSSFCSTLGQGADAHRFYFQRSDPTNGTVDAAIPRNQEIYTYLQDLTEREIPGFGGKFSDKYDAEREGTTGGPIERDQILTEMLDYIRTTNLYDHSMEADTRPRYTRGYGHDTGYNQVVPLQIGETRGLGRMYTISEVGLLIAAVKDGNGALLPDGTADPLDWRNVSNPGDPEDRVPPLRKELQAMLLLEVTSPMQGYDILTPAMEIRVDGLNLIQIGNPSETQGIFPAAEQVIASPGLRTSNNEQYGGVNSFHYYMKHAQAKLISGTFEVDTDEKGQGALQIATYGDVTITLHVKKKGTDVYDDNPAQTIKLSFPTQTVPIPDLIQTNATQWTSSTKFNKFTNNVSNWWDLSWRASKYDRSNHANGNGDFPYQHEGAIIRSDPPSIKAGEMMAGWALDKEAPHPGTRSFYAKRVDGTMPSQATLSSDVVRTLVTRDGDWRLMMAKKDVDARGKIESDMVKHVEYDNTNLKLIHSFMMPKFSHTITGVDLGGKLTPGANYSERWVPKVPSNLVVDSSYDWDNGLPYAADGAYANKPDEGNIANDGSQEPYYNAEQQGNMSNFHSYFTANRIIASPVMFGGLPTGVLGNVSWRTLNFKPATSAIRHRDEPGPPDHLLLDLFNMPVVEPYAISEPFSTAGKVNMNYQIVPFTYIERTTGMRGVLSSELIARVNTAYAKKTDTWNMGALYKEKPGANPPASVNGTPVNARLPIDMEETLSQFEDRFAAWDLFRSPSEICDIYLVPEDPNNTALYSMPSFKDDWYGPDFGLVGDNVRERPYANIYPRLTTKSNSFTVHFKVQALKATPALTDGQWDESKGTIIGEYRGSTSLERFLDPNNPNIPDYAADLNAEALDNYYQWRVVSNTSFSP